MAHILPTGRGAGRLRMTAAPPTDAGRLLAKMADRFYVNCPLAPGPVEIDGPGGASPCRGLPPPPRRRRLPVQRRRPRVPRRGARGRPASRRAGGAQRRAPTASSRFRLEVAAPLPKGDRAQFLVEKLTELGVTAFTPLQTARSVVHPREAKLDKLRTLRHRGEQAVRPQRPDEDRAADDVDELRRRARIAAAKDCRSPGRIDGCCRARANPRCCGGGRAGRRFHGW